LEKLLGPFLARADRTILDPTPNCSLLDLQMQNEPDWGKAEVDPKKRKLVAACADGLWTFSRGPQQYLVGQTLSIFGTDHEQVYTKDLPADFGAQQTTAPHLFER